MKGKYWLMKKDDVWKFTWLLEDRKALKENGCTIATNIEKDKSIKLVNSWNFQVFKGHYHILIYVLHLTQFFTFNSLVTIGGTKIFV